MNLVGNCSLRLSCFLRLVSASPASLLQAQVRPAISPAVPADTESVVSLLVITEFLDIPDPFVCGPTGTTGDLPGWLDSQSVLWGPRKQRLGWV